jgi:hypothetical protein
MRVGMKGTKANVILACPFQLDAFRYDVDDVQPLLISSIVFMAQLKNKTIRGWFYFNRKIR